MAKLKLIILSFLLFSSPLFSQVTDLEKGDEYFYKGALAYKQALPHYLNAIDSDAENAYLNFKIGRCFLYSESQEKSISYFQKALDLKEKKRSTAQYFLGVAYQHNQEFDKAISNYKAYLESIKGLRRKKENKQVEKRILECNFAKEYTKNSSNESEKSDSLLNSEFSDYMAVDDYLLGKTYFTSRRIAENSNKSEIDSLNNQAFEDIYSDTETIENAGLKFNTTQHDAIVSISQNGKYCILYRSENGGDLYLAEKENKVWSDFLAFPKPINTRFHESSAFINNAGNTLYIVSNRNHKTKHDIFYSEKNDKGEWEKPQVLSDSINTIYEEESVFLHPDGNTIFFSSQGHSSMGGFDVFYSVKNEEGEWTKAQNLAYPINSTENDLFYSVSGDGSTSYYSSDKKGGFGEHDIYKTDVFDDIFVLNFFAGKIIDADTKEPVHAKFELFNDENENVLEISNSSDSGSYFQYIKPGVYNIRLITPDYIYYNTKIEIPETNRYDTLFHTIELEKLEKNSTIVLTEIQFDYSKSTFQESSFFALDQIAAYLTNNPIIEVEISGHTDNLGSREVNLILSQERAQAVVDYLLKKGISENRLIAKGYAFDKPLELNTTASGRQKNRRVEFKILKLTK